MTIATIKNDECEARIPNRRKKSKPSGGDHFFSASVFFGSFFCRDKKMNV
jgi:hypothetical protein